MYGFRADAVSVAHARPIIECISFSVVGILSINGEIQGIGPDSDANAGLEKTEEDEEDEEEEGELEGMCSLSI